MGKNIFTNALPLALANYMSEERDLDISLIEAKIIESGVTTTEHRLVPWADIIRVPVKQARYNFETVFKGYNAYTHTSANKSDVVVSGPGGEHTRALEVKLVVTPTSGTANNPREKQSCEIVVRPPSIEQLAFSIAHSFGTDRRHELADILAEQLQYPHDFHWSETAYMRSRVDLFVEAAEAITRAGVEVQTPLFLIATWRTEGQSPRLDEYAFDAFVATDLAFLTLFTKAAKNQKKPRKGIARPERALIWLVYALWQYATQGSLNFGNIHERLTYGLQSDKAGAFTAAGSLRLMKSDNFFYPRVRREEVTKIISTDGLTALKPERRLDQALWTQGLLDTGGLL